MYAFSVFVCFCSLSNQHEFRNKYLYHVKNGEHNYYETYICITKMFLSGLKINRMYKIIICTAFLTNISHNISERVDSLSDSYSYLYVEQLIK